MLNLNRTPDNLTILGHPEWCRASPVDTSLGRSKRSQLQEPFLSRKLSSCLAPLLPGCVKKALPLQTGKVSPCITRDQCKMFWMAMYENGRIKQLCPTEISVFPQSTTHSGKHSFMRPSQSCPVLRQMPVGIVAFDIASCSFGGTLGWLHVTASERERERASQRAKATETHRGQRATGAAVAQSLLHAETTSAGNSFEQTPASCLLRRLIPKSAEAEVPRCRQH